MWQHHVVSLEEGIQLGQKKACTALRNGTDYSQPAEKPRDCRWKEQVQEGGVPRRKGSSLG